MIYCHSLMLAEINNIKIWNDYDDNIRTWNFDREGEMNISKYAFPNTKTIRRYILVCILFETFFNKILMSRIKATMKLKFKTNESQDSKNKYGCLVDDCTIYRIIAFWGVAIASCFVSCYRSFFLAAHFSCSTLCSTSILGKCHQANLFILISRQ